MSKRKSTALGCELEILQEPFDHCPAQIGLLSSPAKVASPQTPALKGAAEGLSDVPSIKAHKCARIPHSNSGTAIPSRLPTRLRDDGFDLLLIKRNGRIAIYRKSKPTHHLGYETVIIRTLPARNAFGKYYPSREVYPYSEQWGKYGWTYRTLAEANRKFTSLIEQREVR